MKSDFEDIITESDIGHANPKYMPQGRYTMRFAGITNNRVKTKYGASYHVVRVHFFVDTPWHGRRKFYKQYYPGELGQLEYDLRHYLDGLYPRNTRSQKKRFTLINKLKGRYADIRLATVEFCPRFGIISRVTEYHGCGYFRYQEFMANKQNVELGTLGH